MNMRKWIVCAVVAAAAVAGAVFWFGHSSEKETGTPAVSSVAKAGRNEVAGKGKSAVKVRQLRNKARGAGKADLGSGKRIHEKPTFQIDEEDEANLNETQKKLIAEIRAALDDNDKKRVLALVRQIQASDEWPDGVPRSIKMAAVNALAWFGSAGIVELGGFLSDNDASVVQTAIEKYEESLSDPDLGDRERSLILVYAAKAINDADAMDSMMFELNNMRHSVAIDTIKQIMEEGTAASKSVLSDNVEMYTGEENLDTPEKLDEWLENNPDEPDDDDFYGGSKDCDENC